MIWSCLYTGEKLTAGIVMLNNKNTNRASWSRRCSTPTDPDCSLLVLLLVSSASLDLFSQYSTDSMASCDSDTLRIVMQLSDTLRDAESSSSLFGRLPVNARKQRCWGKQSDTICVTTHRTRNNNKNNGSSKVTMWQHAYTLVNIQ